MNLHNPGGRDVKPSMVLIAVIGIALLLAAIGCSAGTGEPDIEASADARGKHELAVSPTPIEQTAAPNLDAITEVKVDAASSDESSQSTSVTVPKKCTLSGGGTVDSGWSGKGTGHNYCNNCFCSNGALGCTKMLCPVLPHREENTPLPTATSYPTYSLVSTPTHRPSPTSSVDTSFRPSISARYDVVLESGTIYGTGKTGDGQQLELVLDIAVPKTDTDALRPLMVQIHGGAFKGGSRIGFGKGLFDRAAQRGWVVASIDYRLMGDDPIPGPQMQEMLDAAMGDTSDPGQNRAAVAAVEDTIVSLRYLLGRGEELNLDPSRVVLVGGSAGAITALNVAYASDNFGVDRPEIAATVAFWGAIYEELGGESTMDHGEAPLFIVHGTEDKVVEFSHALDLVKGAKSAGIHHEFHPVEGAPHGFKNIDLRTNITDDGRDLESAMFEFLDQVLY